ncbi:hypothetical protein JQC67_03795 [Aurantibacter crassamenti]|uniref:hypothetical protein n=1 Tax=Aurantibacter crassamenti TaxID=1837375 RepID=UPI00193A5591|nr:hypothetical protein [Aurantibacter crassamenti]MBM1105256.1 hypothetical protein [Aurantibacter crassamenti]
MTPNPFIFGKHFFVWAACFVLLSCSLDEEYDDLTEGLTELEAGELIYYSISKFDENTNSYTDTFKSTRIIPERSALVLIDVWKNEFLDTLTINNINPLIEEFNAMGSKVIYAPSQEPQNENLLIIEEGVHFYDLDVMDGYLNEHEIENLFYVGFDTFHCVLDKPNGIFNIKKRKSNLKIFVLEEGVLSFTKEMKESSLALLKKNNVGIVENDANDLEFPQQTIVDIYAKTKEEARAGNNFVILFENSEYNVDIENLKNELLRLKVNYGTVKKGILEFNGREITPPDFIKLLRDQEVRNLYYAGSYLNNELLWSDYGVLQLYVKIRYQNVQGLPWPYIINDMALMAPTHSLDVNLEKATILNHYRMIHNITSTTLLNDLELMYNEANLAEN